MTTTNLTSEQQSAVLYWPMIAKIPIIPCDSKTKGFRSHPWKDVDFSQTDWESNLAAGLYDNGIALVLGKTLPGCPYPYSFAFDFDGIDAVMEFFGSWDNVLKLANTHRIEWHDDKGRLHIVFFCEKDVTTKRIVIKQQAFEIRSNDLLIVSPSIHNSGIPWAVLGTEQNILFKSNEQMTALHARIDSLSSERGYMSDEDRQAYIEWLERPETRIKEGWRHDALIALGCSSTDIVMDGDSSQTTIDTRNCRK